MWSITRSCHYFDTAVEYHITVVRETVMMMMMMMMMCVSDETDYEGSIDNDDDMSSDDDPETRKLDSDVRCFTLLTSQCM